MRLVFIFLVFSAWCCSSSFAQTGRQISGIVQDSTGMSIAGATVKLTSDLDTLITSTNPDGIFVFRNVKKSQFLISVSIIGFANLNKRFLYTDETTRLTLEPLILSTQSKQLGEVIISGVAPVTVKEDTIEYKADAYKLKENAVVEDLLKKLPGVEVDKDGNVTAQGKQVTKVRVNGKDFFGGDVRTATQQLPADIVDKIQIIEDYGDQANLTGIRDGDPERIMNIQTRPDKNNGYVGRGTIAGGDQERYQGTLNVNYFNNNTQISVLGNLNNINANLFNFSGGGGGGAQQIAIGGGGRGGFGAFGGFGGANSGLTDVKSFGFNYRGNWGKKLVSFGSYSFTDRTNDVLSSTVQQSIFQNNTITDSRNTDATNNSINHRFTWNFEYRPDTANFIKFTPNISYSKNTGINISSFVLSRQENQINSFGATEDNTFNDTPNFNGTLLYNYRFPKRGRNFSINLNGSTAGTQRDNDLLNQSTNFTQNGAIDVFQRQLQLDDNANENFSARLSYNEPLSRKANLEFNYAYTYANVINDRETFGLNTNGDRTGIIDSLSNDYKFNFITNRFGANYRYTTQKYNFSIGVGVQPNVLSGSSISRNTNTRKTATNFFPVARFNYNFTREKSLQLNYNGRSNQPSFNQLQPVTDVSNPQFVTVGNPNLGAEFINNFSIRFNNSNFFSGRVLFTNISVNLTKDKIVTNVVNIPGTIIQETRYQNTNGQYNLNGFYAWSRPYFERKLTISFGGLANYNNNVSFINNQENIGKNWILSQRLNLQINPAEWVEITPGLTYTYNQNRNTINTQSNTNVTTWTYAYDSKIYFAKTWTFGLRLDKSVNQGFSGGVSSNPLIINSYIEKSFLKGNSGTLRLQAFDLLNQSTNISRVVNANGITDNQTNQLARYFLLSFSMRLQKFAGSNVTTPDVPGNRTIIRMGGGRGNEDN